MRRTRGLHPQLGAIILVPPADPAAFGNRLSRRFLSVGHTDASLVFEYQFHCLCVRPKYKVRTAQRGFQERCEGATPPAVFDIDVVPTSAEHLEAIEVGHLRISELYASFDKCPRQRIRIVPAGVGDDLWPVCSRPRVDGILLPFELLEVRQEIFVRPASRTLVTPIVKIR